MTGKTTIRRAPHEERSRPSIPSVRVLFTPSPGMEGRSFRLGTTSTIGRAEGTTITFASDGQVSRVHATISTTGGLTIADSSTNGTYVRGKRQSQGPLGDGDVVRVGDSLLLVRLLAEDAVTEPEDHGLLGDAPVMHEVRRTLKLVGPTDATVLVTGPSGTGKEVVARAIHREGRPNGPFVAVNCSAIPETLAESQLFGHVAGSFTGAKSDHPGFFRAANKGTIFLDEIGELPLGLQAKLLRALEERSVIPVGAVAPIAFDARVVAATNRRLALEVAQSRFRGDLLARLTEIEIAMPKLSERAEDVLPILRHVLGDAPPISPDLAEALVLYDWPYNVRELTKVAAELRIRGAGAKVLELRLVADRLRRSREAQAAAKESVRIDVAPASPTQPPSPIPTKDELVALLADHKGSVADVARATGRSRKQVYRWIESHGIDVESFRG